MELKRTADDMNNLSGGENVYGYDETANKIIVINRQNGATSIISLEKAHNILKSMALGMQTILTEIFESLIEDKPASKEEDK
jgi:hypothetical protein